MSIVLEVLLEAQHSTYTADAVEYRVPVGTTTLAAMITGDPPAPEDLTNAIGLLVDHLDDVAREVPAADLADGIVVRGAGVATVAAVETGGPATLPFVLHRRAAEDVFRTLATETRADRRHNPGLPGDEVHTVLGACCALVAVLRRFQRDSLTIAAERTEP